MAGLLASVATLAEAELALELGADILDLKQPALGALGAWEVGAVRAAVARFGGGKPLSATIGDLPLRPGLVLPAVEEMAAAGVDYVKIGFFPGGEPAACLEALGEVAGRTRLVAVLMADMEPDFGLVGIIARAGFAGVMLDTARKGVGGLRRHQSEAALAGFVGEARAGGLLCGLAGSLGLGDIPALARLGPDYLGFRGALCGGERTGALDACAFAAVRAAVSQARSATATAGAQVAIPAAA